MQSRRKPAAQSIQEESASSGLLAQSAAVPIVLPHTLPEEGQGKRGGEREEGREIRHQVFGGKVEEKVKVEAGLQVNAGLQVELRS